jgi:putative spermidine/putrescine transport system substrate-binding protein
MESGSIGNTHFLTLPFNTPNPAGAEHKQQLAEMNRGASVLSAQELKNALLPEVDSQYVNWIKENWLREVVQP